jgi:hypothetical protein
MTPSHYDKSVLRCQREASLLFPSGAEVNAEVMAFLVEMAAFKTEILGCLRHVIVVLLPFGWKQLPLEVFDSLDVSVISCW